MVLVSKPHLVLCRILLPMFDSRGEFSRSTYPKKTLLRSELLHAGDCQIGHRPTFYLHLLLLLGAEVVADDEQPSLCAVQDFVADGSHDDREVDSDEVSQDEDDSDQNVDSSTSLLYGGGESWSPGDEAGSHGGGDGGGGGSSAFVSDSSFEPSASPADDDLADEYSA